MEIIKVRKDDLEIVREILKWSNSTTLDKRQDYTLLRSVLVIG